MTTRYHHAMDSRHPSSHARAPRPDAGLDAFPGTDLEALLKANGVETLVLAGASVCLPTCLSIRMSAFLPSSLPACLLGSLSASMVVCLSGCLSDVACLPACLPVVRLSACLLACLCLQSLSPLQSTPTSESNSFDHLATP